MTLLFQYNYKEYSDKELVDKITTEPYNEEAAAYLIYNRYDPLLGKIYRKVFYGDSFWYEDCLGDLFDYLRGKEHDWYKLRTFEWRCRFASWLGKTAKNRFMEIKPSLIGKIKNPISIDGNDDERPRIQLPEGGEEEYERQQRRILILEAISLLEDRDQKFVILKRLQGYNSREISELMKMSWEKHNIKKYNNKGNLVIPTPSYVDVKTQRAKDSLREIIIKLTK